MKSLHIAGITLFAVLTLIAQHAFAQNDLARLDALLAEYHRAGVFNGVVLLAKGDDVIHQSAIGDAVMEWDIPNSIDTRFRIGSVTKQFTSAMILQLVEEGLLELNAPMSRYLPDYPKAQADKVSIHHLLTHTSGIPSYTNMPEFTQQMMRTRYERDAFLKIFSELPLEYEPGELYRYNNSGYFILGVIIEKVTGKSYDRVLRERITTPLGLGHTGYEHNNDMIARMANGYQRIPGGYERAPFLDTSVPFAAGMIYSTAPDLLKWTRALHAGKVFKKKETLQAMLTPTRDNYAYGLMVTKTVDGDRSITRVHHSGGINGFTSQLWYMPDDEYTIVALDNTTSNTGLAADAAFSLLYGRKLPVFRFPIAEEVGAVLQSSGIDAAITRYRELRGSDKKDDYDCTEQQLNGLGYLYLGRGEVGIARRLLALNLEMFPDAFNAWDSMGEVHMTAGETDEAVRHYRKALELNPGSSNAKSMLTKLGVDVAVKEVSVPEAVLDSYLGRYELQPGFVLTVTREGKQLSMQATNQPRVEVYPASESTFYLKVVDAQVSFIRNPEGIVDTLILHQGGHDMPAKRVQ
jgi:CubicO group peptidase (beta-lactamase class C family)